MNDSGQGWLRCIPSKHIFSMRTVALRGIALPEALMALALLGVALNGLLAAHWQARQLQLTAASHQHALLVLQDFAVRWRLNPAGDSTYRDALAQTLPESPHVDACQWQSCTPAARAQADISALAMQLRQGLIRPQWRFEPCTDAPAHCLLVAWAGTEASAGPEGSCLDASGQRQPGAQCTRLVLP